MMGVLKKVIILSCLVLLAALVWQWTRSIDIQGKKIYESLKDHKDVLFCSNYVIEFYKGKRVILTGASRGIGKSLAIQLAQLGAK
jgi:NADPH:quinone reductase-like Zn-dependent oxidoreductase